MNEQDEGMVRVPKFRCPQCRFLCYLKKDAKHEICCTCYWKNVNRNARLHEEEVEQLRRGRR